MYDENRQPALAILANGTLVHGLGVGQWAVNAQRGKAPAEAILSDKTSTSGCT